MKLQKFVKYSLLASLSAVWIFSGLTAVQAYSVHEEVDLYISPQKSFRVIPDDYYEHFSGITVMPELAGGFIWNNLTIGNFPEKVVTITRREGQASPETTIVAGEDYEFVDLTLYELGSPITHHSASYTDDNGNVLSNYSWENEFSKKKTQNPIYKNKISEIIFGDSWKNLAKTWEAEDKSLEEIRDEIINFVDANPEKIFGNNAKLSQFRSNFDPLPVGSESGWSEEDYDDWYNGKKPFYIFGYTLQDLLTYYPTYMAFNIKAPGTLNGDRDVIVDGALAGTTIKNAIAFSNGKSIGSVEINIPAGEIPAGEYEFDIPITKFGNIQSYFGNWDYFEFKEIGVGKVKVRVEVISDNTTPVVPTVPAPDVPTLNSPSGPGWYIPVTPVLFESPILNQQCVSHIKNLDDEKLIQYYSTLRVEDLDSVDGSITRAELVRLIANASLVDVSSIDMSLVRQFADVSEHAYYAPYLAYALQNQIVNGQDSVDEAGNPIKIFRPYDKLTRAEAAKILVSLIKKSPFMLPSKESIHTFADISPEFPLASFVQEAYDACLLHGRNTRDWEPVNNEARRFEPHDNITVAEVSKVLYNMTHRYEK